MIMCTDDSPERLEIMREDGDMMVRDVTKGDNSIPRDTVWQLDFNPDVGGCRMCLGLVDESQV